MEKQIQYKEPIIVGKTETGKDILFYKGGFPNSAEARQGNPLFQNR